MLDSSSNRGPGRKRSGIAQTEAGTGELKIQGNELRRKCSPRWWWVQRTWVRVIVVGVGAATAVVICVISYRLPATTSENEVHVATPDASLTITIAKALDAFMWDTGSYPKSDEGIKALTQPKSAANDVRYKGSYLDSDVITDPWGNPFKYRCPGVIHKDAYDLWSLGPNGIDDSDKDDNGDDIVNKRVDAPPN